MVQTALLLPSLLLLGPLSACAEEFVTGSCAQKHGLLQKVQDSNLKAQDVKAYLGCLKGRHADMNPKVVQFLTSAAKRRGAADEASNNCRELIEKDGCDKVYGEKLKAITGVQGSLTAGDLCTMTCSSNHTGDSDAGDSGAGDTGEGESCAEKHGLVDKVKEGNLKARDVKDYLGCLKSRNVDMMPRVVQFLTNAAKRGGEGEEVSNNCTQLIDLDGCDEDYGEKMKGLTGVAGQLTAGDFCPRTCSAEDAGGDEDEDENGDGEEDEVERKFLVEAMPFGLMSSETVGTSTAALAAALLAVSAFALMAGRRASPAEGASTDAQALLEAGEALE